MGVETQYKVNVRTNIEDGSLPTKRSLNFGDIETISSSGLGFPYED